MQGWTKCILMPFLFSVFLFLFYNIGILKLSLRKTIDKMLRTHSRESELRNKRQNTSEREDRLSSNIAKVKNYVSKSRSEKGQVKVLLLAYGRTGSSLTGELISSDTTSAYFFEPFW